MTKSKLITKYVSDWLVRADEDIRISEILREEGEGLPSGICFHAQQAGEKYFKAFLAFQEINVRKTHGLVAPLTLCEETDKSFNKLKLETDYLNRFYIEARYPADIPEFSLKEAEQALASALRIKEFVLRKIR